MTLKKNIFVSVPNISEKIGALSFQTLKLSPGGGGGGGGVDVPLSFKM